MTIYTKHTPTELASQNLPKPHPVYSVTSEVAKQLLYRGWSSYPQSFIIASAKGTYLPLSFFLASGNIFYIFHFMAEGKSIEDLIIEEHRLTRKSMTEFHQFHREWMVKFHDMSERHHQENMQVLNRFQDILDNILKPGDN